MAGSQLTGRPPAATPPAAASASLSPVLPAGRLRRLVLPGTTDLPWIRRRGEEG